MALQAPAAGTAASKASPTHTAATTSQPFAGPWLRFAGGAGPLDEREWRGSVLCGTRGGGAADEQLTLQLLDGDGAGDGAGGAATAPRRLTPALLHSEQGWRFWRWELELQLGSAQRPVRYAVHAGGRSTPTYTFWLPGAGSPMHWGYYSCNGLSDDVKPTAPERADPSYLWRDLLQLHAAFPLHALVGGGDQCYNDGVWRYPALRAWGARADHGKKVKAEWTAEMEGQAAAFYLQNYIEVFSSPDVDMALAQIPQVMVWDDHDIWDGFGSYEPATQGSPVFQGLFRVARRFYLLFQQHTTDAFNAEKKEFLGPNDGAEFHMLRFMGPQVALLGMDMRSQRSKQRVMPESAYALLRDTVAALPPGPLHLVILSGIPLIFPKIPSAETVLGCLTGIIRRTPVVKNMARETGLLDRFDQAEILDDLIDGWVADVHQAERLQFIRLLQDFATSKRLRVSILSGDAHVGGVGRLYTHHPKIKPLSDDPLFMIISSAIVNAPPPHPVTKMLMRTNFSSNVDSRTREKLVRAFYPFHPRTDKLIAQRNWCDVSLVLPPFSPPTVPQDPNYAGLRFLLRVENPRHRRGYAEETYIIVAPRYPGAALTVAPLGGSASSAAPLPSGALVTPVASPAGPAPQRLPDGEPREQAAEVEAEEEQRAKPAAPPAPQGVGGSPPPPAPVAAS